ncbi:MAG: GAF domain-containing sensor histidine kinase [Anaerolineae bacterium]
MPSEKVRLEGSFLETSTATTLQALLGGLLEVAIRATEANEGSIILLDHDLELLTMGLAGGPKKTIVRAARRHLERSISAWVADHKEPLLLVGPAKDPRFAGVERDIKDAVCVPLIVEDRVIGVLSVSNRRGSENFVQHDLEKLTALAEPSARVIASALAYVDAEERGYLWERKRLAQEIHDGLIQELTAVFLQLEIYERLKDRDSEKAEEQLGRTKQQVKASLQGLRRLLFDLRAADVGEVSLKHILERSVNEFERATGIATTLKVTGQERELPPQTKGNLIAIAEESLANAKKHSGAKHVLVHLNYEPEEVELSVADDGRGFNWQEAIQRAWTEKKFGLMGMQERAHILGGNLEIESVPGGGSTVKVRVPVKASEVTDEP